MLAEEQGIKVRSNEEAPKKRKKGVTMDGKLEETAKGGKAEVERKEKGILA